MLPFKESQRQEQQQAFCSLLHVFHPFHSILPKGVEGRQQQTFRIPHYVSSAAEDTCNMCLLFSSAYFGEEYRGRLDPVSHTLSQSQSPFSSGLAGSRSSRGSLSGTIGRASHSLISHTKGARSTREVEGQQRVAALAHEHSCTLTVGQVQALLHQACLDRVANDTLQSTFST